MDKYRYFTSVLLCIWSTILTYDGYVWFMIMVYDDCMWFMIFTYDVYILR